MAAEPQLDEYSKRTRILNALAVYPEWYEIHEELLAELTDSSASYVYRIQRDIESGELARDEVEEEYDEYVEMEEDEIQPYWETEEEDVHALAEMHGVDA